MELMTEEVMVIYCGQWKIEVRGSASLCLTKGRNRIGKDAMRRFMVVCNSLNGYGVYVLASIVSMPRTFSIVCFYNKNYGAIIPYLFYYAVLNLILVSLAIFMISSTLLCNIHYL